MYTRGTHSVLPLLLFVSAAVCGVVSAYRQTLAEFDQQVQQIVRGMTLEEKLGQMGQLSFNSMFNTRTADAVLINEAWFNSSLDRFFVGSLFDSPAGGGFSYDPKLLNRISLDMFRQIVTRMQQIAKVRGAKSPILFALDLVHGAHYIYGSTLFPQQINLAATFNRDHARAMGDVTARNARAAGVRWTFNPIGDLALQPSWPRVYEQFGEDPYLSSQMIAAEVYGLQGQPAKIGDHLKIAACMKHFIGYGNPRNGHDQDSTWIADRYLQMYFVPVFEAAVKAGVATTMEDYVDINGEPVAGSHKYLVELLREQLGFDGLLVTDWQEINQLYAAHHVANSSADAVRLFLAETSIDMDMIPIVDEDPNNKYAPRELTFNDFAATLVRGGQISQDRIDVSTARIIQLKKDLGLLDDPFPPPTTDEAYTTFGSKADEDASLQTARESLILLKNNRTLLPLSTSSRLLLVGPGCNSKIIQVGGWSIHWQGPYNDDEVWSGKTLLQAIRDAYPQVQATHIPVFSFSPEPGQSDACYLNNTELDAALAAVANADVIVSCVGEQHYAEKPGDIDTLELFPVQQLVLRRLAATGKPMVTLLMQGRPRVLNGTADLASAIIYAMLPGPYGGQALAELLFGAYSPSGRLPLSYPKAVSNTLNPYWRNFMNNDNYRPEWKFGYGLSYTTFTYSNLKITPITASEAQPVITVSVDVTNTGAVASAHSVLLFTQQTYRIISPEVRLLKAFDKIFLQPGEKKTVTLTINVDQLSFYGLLNERRWQNGEFVVFIGSEDDAAHIEGGFTLKMVNPTPCPFKVTEQASDSGHLRYSVLPTPGHVVTSVSYKQTLTSPAQLMDRVTQQSLGDVYTAEPRSLQMPFYLVVNERGSKANVPITFFSDKAVHTTCFD